MSWNPDKPIALLPNKINQFYVEQADYLYIDLESNRLEVILIPAPDQRHYGHKVRKVQNKNPGGYRDLYWSRDHFGRDRSLMALDRIRKKEDRPFRVSISDEQMSKIKQIWNSTWVASDEMINLVKKLKKKYILAILSNSDALNSEHYTEKGWYSFFDYLILSHELGIIKSEKRIYEITLEKLNLHAKQCLLIDDKKSVLLVARKIGFKTIHFKSIDQLKNELKKLEIEF